MSKSRTSFCRNDTKSRTTFCSLEKKGKAEVDFIFKQGSNIYPLEVKAEENLQSKSLKVFSEKFNPAIAIRTSMRDYRREDWLMNVPLYAIGTDYLYE